MKKLYELKVSLVIDDDQRDAILDHAKRYYSLSGGASTLAEDGAEHTIPPEEAIQSIAEALMELVQGHPAFDGEAIEVLELTCTSEDTALPYDEDALEGEASDLKAEGDDSTLDEACADGHEDDLDAYEADAYLCRWPNGDCSIVSATSKREAIIRLDEWGGAHPSQIYPLESFKCDFGLTDEGELVLHEFGEATREFILETCYPELAEVLVSESVFADSGELKPGGREIIAEAVQHERQRLWDNQPEDTPKTELGKRVAREMGTSATVADYYVDQAAKRILESDEGEDGQPN